MRSKVCTNVVTLADGKTKKICNATQFLDENEQCPKLCAHCDGVLNPDFAEDYDENIEKKTGLRLDGPTLIEYVTEGFDIDSYPPKGYKAKPFTAADMRQALEIADKAAVEE